MGSAISFCHKVAPETEDESSVLYCLSSQLYCSSRNSIVCLQAKGIFGLCLVDEIHKAKSKGSGVGFALTALTTAARYTIGLTGTLFGGYSAS